MKKGPTVNITKIIINNFNMEMHNIEQEEIKPLIFNYFFHFILFILIFILHLVIYNKIYWISNVYSKIFLISSFFEIIYFIYPIIPFFMIFLKRFKLKAIKIFKIISIILLITTIIFGLLISLIVLINTINSKTFCQECPFSLSLSHLNFFFNSYYGTVPNQDEIEDKCKHRICILNSMNLNNKYPYKYLCNYDPSYDFTNDEIYKRNFPNGTEISAKSQFICSPIGINYKDMPFNYNELYDYLDLCYYLSEFYYCERFNLPKKVYDLDFGSKCPEFSYLFILYIVCVIIIIIDIVISMLPWGVEIISLKRIIQLMQIRRRKPNSHNSTAKSSVISNNEESFKKEKTLILVLPSNTEDNLFQVNNKLCIKDSSKEIINNNQDKDEKNKDINRHKIILNSERNELKSNLLNNHSISNTNSINLFNKNENKKEIK